MSVRACVHVCVCVCVCMAQHCSLRCTDECACARARACGPALLLAVYRVYRYGWMDGWVGGSHPYRQIGARPAIHIDERALSLCTGCASSCMYLLLIWAHVCTEVHDCFRVHLCIRYVRVLFFSTYMDLYSVPYMYLYSVRTCT
jgi:hypothetical protein